MPFVVIMVFPRFVGGAIYCNTIQRRIVKGEQDGIAFWFRKFCHRHHPVPTNAVKATNEDSIFKSKGRHRGFPPLNRCMQETSAVVIVAA